MTRLPFDTPRHSSPPVPQVAIGRFPEGASPTIGPDTPGQRFLRRRSDAFRVGMRTEVAT